MGGAERAERKRRKQPGRAGGASPVAAARANRSADRGWLVGGAVVVLLALVVGVGLWLQSRNEPEELPATIPVSAAGPDYPVVVEGNAVVTGPPDAPVTIDVYEDFLCPACQQFEQNYGARLEEAAATGRARVVYHPVAILDRLSTPPGYSTLAADAALCAADAGIFPRYYHSLFDNQPQEGGPGWTSAQLQQLGRDLGADEDFAQCVQSSDGSRITAATDDARERYRSLRPDEQFGTPTILVDGEFVDPYDLSRLDKALEATG